MHFALQMQEPLGHETKEREHKDVPLIEGKRGGTKSEEEIMRNILHTFDHSEMKKLFNQSFRERLKLYASKYFSQILNGTHITINFGISDMGKINGFPIDDFDELQIQQIAYEAFVSICNATSENKQFHLLMHSILKVQVEFTKVQFTDDEIRESKTLYDQKISIIEQTIQDVNRYNKELEQYKKDMQRRWEQVNTSMINVICVYRVEFICWLKYSKDPALDRFTTETITTIINILEEHNPIEIDTKLYHTDIKYITPDRMNEYMLVQMIGDYKDILKLMLKDETRPPVKPEYILYPYLCMARRYYADIVRVLSIHYPIYTCSITLEANSVELLRNATREYISHGFFCYDTNNARVLMRRTLNQNKEPITDVMHISPDGVPYRKQKRKRDKN